MRTLFPTRSSALQHLATQPCFDVVVVGGGATGLGVALDAVTRGLTVALFESHDFASGTSSKATKLLHGGVRYLAQGHIPLVREALRERTRLLHNAPHNAHALPFVMPSYHWWETPFYGFGLKAYDLLAGAHSLGATQLLSKAETLAALPGVRPEGLSGGVRYMDGQFNDARLAIDLARTAAAYGALVLNYCQVEALIEDAGRVTGVRVVDQETQQSYTVQAACVINATGVWVDQLRTAPPLVKPSQGVHLVVSRDFLPTDAAMMIPKTRDGRVLFMVPWLGHLILGTTDTPQTQVLREPQAAKADVDFILDEAAHYLTRAPQRSDVLSCWAGLRPLVQDASSSSTKTISREHTIEVAANGLLTVTGGKWTTYRSMAEDVLAHAVAAKLTPSTVGGCQTITLQLLGADSPCNTNTNTNTNNTPDADFISFAVQHEFARSVGDVLARRSRTLFIDAAKAEKLAPAVEKILLNQGVMHPKLDQFIHTAQQYQVCP
jgi:glycerol-3-phosphate dehydrogenase